MDTIPDVLCLLLFLRYVAESLFDYKINVKIGGEVIGRIDMPDHASEMKELDRGSLLFYVKFEGGKGYLDKKVFLKDVINA